MIQEQPTCCRIFWLDEQVLHGFRQNHRDRVARDAFYFDANPLPAEFDLAEKKTHANISPLPSSMHPLRSSRSRYTPWTTRRRSLIVSIIVLDYHE